MANEFKPIILFKIKIKIETFPSDKNQYDTKSIAQPFYLRRHDFRRVDKFSIRDGFTVAFEDK